VKLISPGLKIRLIKRIDALVGKPIARLLSSPSCLTDVQVSSILIIRPGGIGDALLLAPTINLLRNNLPGASITILAERRNAGAFTLVPVVDRLLLYDSYADLIHLFGAKFDIIIDTEQWHRMSAVLARLIPSGIKIGFGTNERRGLFTHPVEYSQDEYEAQSFINLLKPLQIKDAFNCLSPYLTIPETAFAETDPFLGPLKAPYVSIFPGASIKERRWGVEKFSELIQRIAATGVTSVVIGGKEDKVSAEAILANAGGLNLAGRTSLAGTAAVIAGSRLLVSGDSGVLHIAAGLGIPTVSLFGAGIANKWAPKGDIHKVINRGLACSPCTLFGTTPVCNYNVRCLDAIDAKEVAAAVDALLI